MLRVVRDERRELTRLERRTESLRDLVRIAMAAFCLGVGGLVVASAFPERRRLHEKEAELFEVLRREADVRAEKEVWATQYRALGEEDREFLEVQARDRLGRCRAGERVFRFER